MVGILYKRTACLERCIEPFMRIDGDGVGFIHSVKEMPVLGNYYRRYSVSPVDMKPAIVALADRGDAIEIVHGARRSARR